VPHFTKVTDIRLFKGTLAQSRSIAFGRSFLRAQALPTFNDEGQVNNPAGYTKQGCFATNAPDFQKNPAPLYAGLPEAEKQQIVVNKTLLIKTVLHTGTGYQFF